MNEIDKRKLNMLVHLAKVDGKFAKSERSLLHQFVKEKGLQETMLDGEGESLPYSEIKADTNGKIDLLFWVLRLIKADDVIHDKELIYARSLAIKLNFKEEIITHFITKPLPDYDKFENEVNRFWLMGL